MYTSTHIAKIKYEQHADIHSCLGMCTYKKINFPKHFPTFSIFSIKKFFFYALNDTLKSII